VRRRLLRDARKTTDAAFRTRLQIVLHYDAGWGAQTIAAALHCAPATAVRVAQRFLAGGEASLLDGRRENGCPKVDEDLVQAAAELVDQSPEDHGWPRPTWTRALLARSLAAQTGVSVSVTTLSRLLRHLGARWGMARPTVACPWGRRRKRARLRAIAQAIGPYRPGEAVYYEDEVDIHLNPRIGRDWMLPGRQKLVLTPGQNCKRYVAGAVSRDGRSLVVVDGDRKNSDLFLALLQALLAKHRTAARIHVVLDNYKIHDSQRVRCFLETLGQRLALHFLPPYSPDANRIERLWREVHANVTRNHRCRTMAELWRRVAWYLHQETRRRSRRPVPREPCVLFDQIAA
jgi:transposase